MSRAVTTTNFRLLYSCSAIACAAAYKIGMKYNSVLVQKKENKEYKWSLETEEVPLHFQITGTRILQILLHLQIIATFLTDIVPLSLADMVGRGELGGVCYTSDVGYDKKASVRHAREDSPEAYLCKVS